MNNELRLPGGRFSTPPPSAILVRYRQVYRNTLINRNNYGHINRQPRQNYRQTKVIQL